jgi:hypothetical protein
MSAKPKTPTTPTKADVDRLSILAAETTHLLRQKRRRLLEVNQDLSRNITDGEKKMFANLARGLAQEIESLEKRLLIEGLHAQRAEHQIEIPVRKSRESEVLPLLAAYEQLAEEIQRDNEAIAKKLTKLGDLAEKVYDATAGTADFHWRMGHDFHVVNRRNRVGASLIRPWPEWIRSKFKKPLLPNLNSFGKEELTVSSRVREDLRSSVKIIENKLRETESQLKELEAL